MFSDLSLLNIKLSTNGNLPKACNFLQFSFNSMIGIQELHHERLQIFAFLLQMKHYCLSKYGSVVV